MMMKTETRVFFSFILLYSICNALHVLSARGGGDGVSYILSCGSDTEDKDTDGRKWRPDEEFLSSNTNSKTIRAMYQDPSLPSTVPYMSARVFTSEVVYNFKVSKTNRHWIRLHFYPTDYGNFQAVDAYFSVVAGEVTLLKDFNSSVTALALTQSHVVKEYTMYPDADDLVITFTPSPEHKGSYAFVNGIEVISMPELFGQADLVGTGDETEGATGIDTMSVALQTMYRLNVGGQYIPATKDSGLTRTWYDDSPYIFGAAAGISYRMDKNERVIYGGGGTNVTEIYAPADVYSSVRSMGSDSEVNKNTNLTWVFEVDSNFTYFLRFHFCELLFDKSNIRPFTINIDNKGGIQMDVTVLSGEQRYVPVYRDYAIYVTDKPGDDNLTVTLSPITDTESQSFDAFLNGLEIYKLNDESKNLAGPNPVPSEYMLLVEKDNAEKQRLADIADEAKRKQRNKVVGGAAGGAAAVGIVAALCIVVYQRKKRIYGTEHGASGWLPLYGSWSNSKSNTGQSFSSSTLSTLAQGLCRHFSLSELKSGTNNFEESQVIGVGGFGKVYRGVVDGGTKVAIKRANPSSEQGIHEFRTEIEMLSKLRHRHLVSLIGFCEEDDEMILVYDYMGNGTLREHLYKSNKPHLSWKQRLEICIGAARGLYYLHTGAKYTIIHRDVKTTNILVDDKWVAKVSDFGLSKTGPALNQTHVSTVVKGSFGYLDPEYFRRQQLTDKSDVYSFGVVLFEVLCARPALNPSLPKEQVSLADWALRCQRKGTLQDIIDPHLKGKINPECLKKFAETAEKCLSDQGIQRPSMGDVLWNLEFSLQLQENPTGASLIADERATTSEASSYAHGADGNFESPSSLDESAMNTNAAFSQLINPQGR